MSLGPAVVEAVPPESGIKKERGTKKESPSKRESNIKRELPIKREPAIKKEFQAKDEPFIKPESSPHNPSFPKTEPTIKPDPELGPVTGHYAIISPQWSQHPLSLTLYADPVEPHLWGSYDFGLFEGVVFLPQRPSIASLAPLPCHWRGREGGVGARERCEGEIAFLGGRRIRGSLSSQGVSTFEGVWVGQSRGWRNVEVLQNVWMEFERSGEEERGSSVDEDEDRAMMEWRGDSEDEEERTDRSGSENGEDERMRAWADGEDEGYFGGWGRREVSEDEEDYREVGKEEAIKSEDGSW